MITISPYLYFNGNCEEAFRFYAAVFGKEISHMSKYKDVPQPKRTMFKEADDKVMHVTLPLDSGNMLNGSDHASVHKEPNQPKTFSLIIHADSEAEVDRLFGALSQNGQIIVPAGLTFWGAYYGQCTDQFGVNWKITLASS